MEEDDKSKLFALMDKYPEVVLAIRKDDWGYRQHLVTTYVITPFKNWCDKKGYTSHVGPEFENQDKGIWFGISLAGWNKYIAIKFNSQDYRDACYGIGEPDVNDPYTVCMPQMAIPFEKYQSLTVDIAKDLIDGKVFNFIRDKFEQVMTEINSCPDKYIMS